MRDCAFALFLELRLPVCVCVCVLGGIMIELRDCLSLSENDTHLLNVIRIE